MDNTDPDQEDNLNLVQRRNSSRGVRDDTDWIIRYYLKTVYYNTLLGLILYKCQYYLVIGALHGLLIHPVQGRVD